MLKWVKKDKVHSRGESGRKNGRVYEKWEEKVHRREGGNVRERGEENAWRSEKGEEEDDKVYSKYERERNINGVEIGRG